MKFEIIKYSNATKTQWSGGLTAQLYIKPDNYTVKDDFDIRISVASINPGENDFTFYRGYERILVILKGSIEISSKNSKFENLKEFKIHEFSGNDSTKSKALQISEDFNVIYKKNKYNIEAKIIDNKEFEEIEIFRDNYIYNYDGISEIKFENQDIVLKSKELLLLRELDEKKCSIKGKVILIKVIKR
ncbi:HutD family protein [Cetobacterium sp. 2A]|uniref:HutD family protein n=1 Tax=unclassified Cetobacterium TaxID=2630983 RepID=UPI00163C6B7B|nr:HutD family protein [Cetobacterium sp. 2A]MBC2857363.1 HutD family protein [Cetobacterium sp. 2A]